MSWRSSAACLHRWDQGVSGRTEVRGQAHEVNCTHRNSREEDGKKKRKSSARDLDGRSCGRWLLSCAAAMGCRERVEEG